MSIEEVSIIVNKCVCEHPDCPGKRKPWYTKNEKVPARCHWCHRTSWNGVDLRHKSQEFEWIRVSQRTASGKQKWTRMRQCTVCGNTLAKGEDVCSYCAGNTKQPKQSAHASGCTCTVCKMKRTKKPSAAITLPKPRKVRRIDD